MASDTGSARAGDLARRPKSFGVFCVTVDRLHTAQRLRFIAAWFLRALPQANPDEMPIWAKSDEL